jgi:hypothetical protein
LRKPAVERHHMSSLVPSKSVPTTRWRL